MRVASVRTSSERVYVMCDVMFSCSNLQAPSTALTTEDAHCHFVKHWEVSPKNAAQKLRQIARSEKHQGRLQACVGCVPSHVLPYCLGVPAWHSHVVPCSSRTCHCLGKHFHHDLQFWCIPFTVVHTHTWHILQYVSLGPNPDGDCPLLRRQE